MDDTIGASGFRRLTIVRHGRAANKRKWADHDDLRPLDKLGERQAAELAGMLAAEPVGRLLSSPTVRCLQTMDALAVLVGRPIETVAELGPTASGEYLVVGLDDASLADAVLCTHGELMRPLLGVLRERGAATGADRRTHDRLLTKGSAWQLELRADGVLEGFRHVLPMLVRSAPGTKG